MTNIIISVRSLSHPITKNIFPSFSLSKFSTISYERSIKPSDRHSRKHIRQQSKQYDEDGEKRILTNTQSMRKRPKREQIEEANYEYRKKLSFRAYNESLCELIKKQESWVDLLPLLQHELTKLNYNQQSSQHWINPNKKYTQWTHSTTLVTLKTLINTRKTRKALLKSDYHMGALNRYLTLFESQATTLRTDHDKFKIALPGYKYLRVVVDNWLSEKKQEEEKKREVESINKKNKPKLDPKAAAVSAGALPKSEAKTLVIKPRIGMAEVVEGEQLERTIYKMRQREAEIAESEAKEKRKGREEEIRDRIEKLESIMKSLEEKDKMKQKQARAEIHSLKKSKELVDEDVYNDEEEEEDDEEDDEEDEEESKTRESSRVANEKEDEKLRKQLGLRPKQVEVTKQETKESYGKSSLYRSITNNTPPLRSSSVRRPPSSFARSKSLLKKKS